MTTEVEEQDVGDGGGDPPSENASTNVDVEQDEETAPDPSSVRSKRPKVVLRWTVKVISVLVYVAIFAVLTAALLNGPISKFLKNDTEIVTDYVKDDGLLSRVYPTIVFCQFPGFRNVNPFQNATIEDESSFLDFVRSEYFFSASELVSSFYLGSYIAFGQHFGKERIDHIFRPFLADCSRFANCFAADTNDLVREFERGAAAANASFGESVFTYTLAFTLRSGNVEKPKDSHLYPTYHAYMIDQGEEMALSGASNLKLEAENEYVAFKPGQVTMHNVDIEFHKNQRHCDTRNRKLSHCLLYYLDKEFNRCRIPNIGKECDYQTMRKGCREADRLKTEGVAYMVPKTGCLLPCERFVYTPNHVFTEHVSKVATDIPNFKGVSLDSAVIFLRFRRIREVRRLREERNYPLSRLVAEVGGYAGLFLGLSFWGAYAAACAAAKRMEEVIFGSKSKRRIVGTIKRTISRKEGRKAGGVVSQRANGHPYRAGPDDEKSK